MWVWLWVWDRVCVWVGVGVGKVWREGAWKLAGDTMIKQHVSGTRCQTKTGGS